MRALFPTSSLALALILSACSDEGRGPSFESGIQEGTDGETTDPGTEGGPGSGPNGGGSESTSDLDESGGEDETGVTGGDEETGAAPPGWMPDPWTGEPDCTSLADLSDVEAAFEPADFMASARALAEERYLPGRALLDAENAYLWFQNPGSFEALVGSAPTGFHESSHMWTQQFAPIGWRNYHLRDDIEIEVQRLDTFPRAEILTVHEFLDVDYRAAVYLMNSAGQQAIGTVLDELNAYTHQLAIAYCTRDYGTGGDHRDAVLVFMYYVEKYLYLGRTQHPGDYDLILEDPMLVDLILTTWQRADHWLEVAEGSGLGLQDALISTYVRRDDNYEEIVRVATH